MFRESDRSLPNCGGELFSLKMLVSCSSGCDSLMEPSEVGNETPEQLCDYQRLKDESVLGVSCICLRQDYGNAD